MLADVTTSASLLAVLPNLGSPLTLIPYAALDDVTGSVMIAVMSCKHGSGRPRPVSNAV